MRPWFSRPSRKAGAWLLAGLCLFFIPYGWFICPLPLEKRLILIPKGSSTREISKLLKERGVISSEMLFFAVTKMSGKSLKAGEYLFSGNLSPSDILLLLNQGRVYLRKFTIPEGWTSRQVISHIKTLEGVMKKDNLSAPPEGSLLPQTYFYTYGEAAPDLLTRASNAMVQSLNAPSLPFPLKTTKEWVILASIVEKETGIPEERPRVASVFLNRLRQGMPLQADPTVAYGLNIEGTSLTRVHLSTPTPFNTYLLKGLPPTPICNPGLASLKAILQAPSTDDLYFVADGTGRHVFAKTYEEHRKNHQSWREIRKKQ